MRSLAYSLRHNPDESPLVAVQERQRPPLQYSVNPSVVPAPLMERFAECHADEDTAVWLEQAARPSWAASSMAQALMLVCSRTSANAVTFRGGMFVFSTAQAETLLSAAFPEMEDHRASAPPRGPVTSGRPLSLLDIGAGDGGVTNRLRPLFADVHATEVDAMMRWRLSAAGYTVVDPAKLPQRYDCVALLNVLDRCDQPWTLLRSLHGMLNPGGVVLLAVVLPWCPFVEDGTQQRQPQEALPMEGGRCLEKASFDKAAAVMVTNVLEPAGFEVLRWARVPYMSEGSATHEYYRLQDAVFVLRPTA